MSLGDVLKQLLRDPAWGAFEAIGTIGATFVALYLGLRVISEEKRNRPDIDINFFRKENLIIGSITNNGLRTSLKTNLRMISVKIDNREFLDKELKSLMVAPFGAIQNGETETVRLFEIQAVDIKAMQFKAPLIPQNQESIWEFKITGENFPAKRIKYRFDPVENSFKKMS